MQTSEKELMKEALNTGFRPEMIEKVWHLMAILDGISVHPFLKDRIVLKGGTALNLFFFDLPRLSVDIDLNYVGKLDRQEMLHERPEVEKALEAIFQREGLSIRRIPEKHAGGKWQLRYVSVLGGNGNLEVDINFMFRTPLYGIHKQCSRTIGSHKTKEIALLDIHELGAGKLSALFGRHASRDLFDTHQLLTLYPLNIEQLRLACLVYGAMGSKDWRQISVDEINFEEKELKNQLIPVLRKHTFMNENLRNWTSQLLVDCKTALMSLFPLREHEHAFLQKIFEQGVVDASLISQDPNLIEKINFHPLLQWKAKLITENNQKLKKS
jgi:predicted nucleotidyltransferase component of viral defense system